MYQNRNYNPRPRYFNLGYEPIVGKNCSLVDVLLDCQAQITIGDNVGFGHGVTVLTGIHDYTKLGAERLTAIISKPVIIKSGAWIASGAIILPGVTIGENSVVGAGSVVTQDVPDNELWVGSSARFIKKI